MSRYRIAFSPEASAALDTLAADRRRKFDSAMRTLADDPYGHGSSAVRGDRDRRDATVSDIIVRYIVSGSVLTVTVVRAVP